jgi:prenyltransferase beta subunit
MRLWEKLSGIIFRLFSLPDIQAFKESNPEQILTRSLKLLDPSAVNNIREFVKSNHTQSGGFADKAGKPDLYYTLFGFYLADALELHELFPSIRKYVEQEIVQRNIDGVHLHCAAILSARLGIAGFPPKYFRKKIRKSLHSQTKRQPAYSVFLNLLSSYYLRDYTGIFLTGRKLKKLNENSSLPAPVTAALLVLQKSFNRPVNKLEKDLMSFYCSSGGFKATKAAPVPDLLSTGVALFALDFAGFDLRIIKPDCLDFVDSLFQEGGFGSNHIDPETDIEYTFYGLLALGSLAKENEQ